MRKSILFLLLVALVLSSRPMQPVVRAQAGSVRRVNVPYFSGDIALAEMGIFWFGRVTQTENYADVRVGYNDDELFLRVAVFDRRLWYDTTPSPDDLTAWDALSLYLNLDGNEGDAPGVNACRFDAQYSFVGSRSNYQTFYRGNGSDWVATDFNFSTESAYRGIGGPNSDADNRGWVVTFHIPFASFGLSGPPSQGTTWGLAMVLHDRDDSAGTPILDKTWPQTVETDRPETWGQLSFGLPVYVAPPAVPGASVTIRHRSEGIEVTDASVGGYAVCGSGLDFWTEWGETGEAFYNPERSDFNIQNQADVADWPCFSKYYATFPLDALPSDKVILSATLTLHQFANSGGGVWGEPEPSLIQVFTVAEEWDEGTLTWNNAPLALENVSAAWVDPLPSFAGWPGVAREWDVSLAVSEAYAARESLRLALYSADGAYHSGKYFVASNTGDWNAEARPALRVTWGQSVATVDKRVSPISPSSGEVITYTVVLRGSGHALVLTDQLFDGLGDPGPVQSTEGSAAYNATECLVEWSGTPAVGQPVTITFPVAVQSSGPIALVNRATLTDTLVGTSTGTAMAIVDGFQVYLPLLTGK